MCHSAPVTPVGPLTAKGHNPQAECLPWWSRRTRSAALMPCACVCVCVRARARAGVYTVPSDAFMHACPSGLGACGLLCVCPVRNKRSHACAHLWPVACGFQASALKAGQASPAARLDLGGLLAYVGHADQGQVGCMLGVALPFDAEVGLPTGCQGCLPPLPHSRARRAFLPPPRSP